MDLLQATPPTVRELIIELRDVEDALRASRHPSGARQIQVDDPQVRDLVHREQQIAHELRRRARAYRRHRYLVRAS